jgi:hypothetical protein
VFFARSSLLLVWIVLSKQKVEFLIMLLEINESFEKKLSLACMYQKVFVPLQKK